MSDSDRLLTAYWIVTGRRHDPLGYGVTAYSLDDAFNIIRGSGYELPEDLDILMVTEGVRVDDLEHDYVRTHMGPIVVRGLWYPCRRVGV